MNGILAEISHFWLFGVAAIFFVFDTEAEILLVNVIFCHFR